MLTNWFGDTYLKGQLADDGNHPLLTGDSGTVLVTRHLRGIEIRRAFHPNGIKLHYSQLVQVHARGVHLLLEFWDNTEMPYRVLVAGNPDTVSRLARIVEAERRHHAPVNSRAEANHAAPPIEKAAGVLSRTESRVQDALPEATVSVDHSPQTKFPTQRVDNTRRSQSLFGLSAGNRLHGGISTLILSVAGALSSDVGGLFGFFGAWVAAWFLFRGNAFLRLAVGFGLAFKETA